MALNAPIPDPKGVTAEYWIIANVSIDALSRSASVTVTGYADRQTRLDHPAEGIVQRRTVAVPTKDFEPMYEDVVVTGESDLYPVLYAYVKEKEPDFSDAENVFEDPQS